MSAGYDWQRTGRRILLDLLILWPHPVTDLTSVTVRALLDTGASSSGVARSVAERLGLPSIGKEPVATAGGTILAERFLARIGFTQTDRPLPYIFDDITAFELSDFGAFKAVLGMDVLAHCGFSMTPNGECSLRFG